MDRIEALNRLRELLRKINRLEETQEQLSKAQANLINQTDNYPSKLAQYDSEHLPSFIEEKLGPQPCPPKGIVKLVFPVYLHRLAIYEKNISTYMKKLPDIETAYREKHAEQRNSLALQDADEQKKAIDTAKNVLADAERAYNNAEQDYQKDDLLSESIKRTDVVNCLISFFMDKRADTLKEAVNLWYDEKRKDEEAERAEEHRKAMLDIEEKRLAAETKRLEAETKRLEAETKRLDLETRKYYLDERRLVEEEKLSSAAKATEQLAKLQYEGLYDECQKKRIQVSIEATAQLPAPQKETLIETCQEGNSMD